MFKGVDDKVLKWIGYGLTAAGLLVSIISGEAKAESTSRALDKKVEAAVAKALETEAPSEQ